MSMKIKGRLAAEMPMKELEELAKTEGKAGRKAQTEISKRVKMKNTAPNKPVLPSTPRKAA